MKPPNSSSRPNPALRVALIVLASLFLHFAAEAADFGGCSACHKELEEQGFRTFLHVPFLQQRCGECHSAKESPSPPPTAPAAGLYGRRKITWLGESLTADTTHAFLLPGGSVESSLVVEMRGNGGDYYREEVAVPRLKDLAKVEDSGRAPVLSDVRVLKVERGVFLSATIGWQTDTLTDALVRYGREDLSQTSEPGKRFGRRHEVVLNNLRPDRIYRFSAVSRDLFGRSSASEPLTLSTSRSSDAPLTVAFGKSASWGKEGLASRFQRVGDDYLFELTLARPASVSVGTRVATRKEMPSGGAGETMPDDKIHADLSSRQAASMAACRGCHQQPATATHPVNVFPKPGMIIPPEYPTLPDGRITCRSCHEPHSSDNEDLTIKRGKRELCVGCHRDML